MCEIHSFSLPADFIGQNLCSELIQQWSKGSKEITPHGSFPTAEARSNLCVQLVFRITVPALIRMIVNQLPQKKSGSHASTQ